MQLKHRAALDGVELDELDSRICVTGISEDTGKYSISANAYGFADGQRVTQFRRDTLEVTVNFRIKVRKHDMATRDQLMEIVNGWALYGGWLTVNYKPDRRLYVTCVKPATPGDAWNWTNEYSILFRAYGVPYWEQVNASSVSFGQAQGCAGGLSVAGTVRSAAEISFKNNAGSAINAITFTCGSSTMAFGSLALGAGETLVIDHTDKGLLRIRIRSTGGVYRSAYDKRLASSSDDLFVNPGAVACSYSPTWNGTCTVSCRGRWV